MSQCTQQIHSGLLIADQWTEPQSKCWKSHAQVLMDRTCATNTLWFLAQDYFLHVHNLSVNRHIN
jgi:hypothetical protein